MVEKTAKIQVFQEVRYAVIAEIFISELDLRGVFRPRKQLCRVIFESNFQTQQCKTIRFLAGSQFHCKKSAKICKHNQEFSGFWISDYEKKVYLNWDLSLRYIFGLYTPLYFFCRYIKLKLDPGKKKIT